MQVHMAAHFHPVDNFWITLGLAARGYLNSPGAQALVLMLGEWACCTNLPNPCSFGTWGEGSHLVPEVTEITVKYIET